MCDLGVYHQNETRSWRGLQFPLPWLEIMWRWSNKRSPWEIRNGFQRGTRRLLWFPLFYTYCLLMNMSPPICGRAWTCSPGILGHWHEQFTGRRASDNCSWRRQVKALCHVSCCGAGPCGLVARGSGIPHRISRYVPAISTKAYSCYARHVSGSRLIWLEYSCLRLPQMVVVSVGRLDSESRHLDPHELGSLEQWNPPLPPPQPMSPTLASTQPNLTSMQARPDPKSHHHVTRRIRSLVTRGYSTRFGKAVP